MLIGNIARSKIVFSVKRNMSRLISSIYMEQKVSVIRVIALLLMILDWPVCFGRYVYRFFLSFFIILSIYTFLLLLFFFLQILPDRNMIGQSIFFLVCSSILQLYIPKLIGDYIDRLGGTSARNTNPNIDIDKFALNRIVLLMVITVSVLCLFNFLWMVMIWCIGDRIVARLRRHLFQCIIYREIGFFDHYRTGELVSRLSSDVNAVNNAITVEVCLVLKILQGINIFIYIDTNIHTYRQQNLHKEQ